jgi:hypothetical protein
MRREARQPAAVGGVLYRALVSSNVDDVLRRQLRGVLQPLTVELQLVLDGQSVDLGEGPTRVLREPSTIEELHGPGPTVVSGPRFDALLVSAVSSNHTFLSLC